MLPIYSLAGQGQISRVRRVEGLNPMNFSLAVAAHPACYMLGKLLKGIHVRSVYTRIVARGNQKCRYAGPVGGARGGELATVTQPSQNVQRETRWSQTSSKSGAR